MSSAPPSAEPDGVASPVSPSAGLIAADPATPGPGALPVSNGVVDAFYLLQNAEALYQSRLRDRLRPPVPTSLNPMSISSSWLGDT